MNQSYNAVITTVPAASALCRVEGFNPLKLLRKVKSERTGNEVLKLELPYQKLWFRLAYPNGRMLLNNLRLTDQLAIFEAIVFSDKNDGNPLSRITASATPSDTPNGRYIEAAQDRALSEALENAGFGIQLCDIAESAGRSDYGSVVPVVPPQEVGESLSFETASPETAQNVQSAGAEQPMNQIAPQAQTPMPPVQQEQANTPAPQAQPAPVAEVATAKSAQQPQTVILPAQPATPTENAMQTADTSVSNTPTAASEAEAVTNPVTNPATAAPIVEAAPPAVEPAAPVAEPASAPVQEQQVETPAVKAEESPARLPTSLELLRASTQAQIVMFPEANTAPAQDAAPEQPAPDDNGGETPMNTAQATGNYTADMTVEEISAKMSLDEARAVVVNEGLCKGWTLGQVAESRPASLRFYVHSNRSDNVLKAAARLVMDGSALKQAG